MFLLSLSKTCLNGRILALIMERKYRNYQNFEITLWGFLRESFNFIGVGTQVNWDEIKSHPHFEFNHWPSFKTYLMLICKLGYIAMDGKKTYVLLKEIPILDRDECVKSAKGMKTVHLHSRVTDYRKLAKYLNQRLYSGSNKIPRNSLYGKLEVKRETVDSYFTNLVTQGYIRKGKKGFVIIEKPIELKDLKYRD